MFTTSRYASAETRALARGMAAGRKERFLARGKKTIAQLAAFARRTGESEISVVDDDASVSVISVSETGGWAWKAT